MLWHDIHKSKVAMSAVPEVRFRLFDTSITRPRYDTIYFGHDKVDFPRSYQVFQVVITDIVVGPDRGVKGALGFDQGSLEFEQSGQIRQCRGSNSETVHSLRVQPGERYLRTRSNGISRIRDAPTCILSILPEASRVNQMTWPGPPKWSL